MARNLYFVGTAGSGKSTMVRAFQTWMAAQGLDAITMNLRRSVITSPHTATS